ncbi:MAG: DUF1700 domain-containing protein [Lachnospiraceae bacterium]|nr:DUF1700 domain-containing protein [Lachnospiraceae bacterium]
MSKEEFIKQLDEFLMGNVREEERLDSIRYYKEYIREEIKAGKTEEEVLDSLGSPYGIAKSIIEAKGYSMDERNDYEESTGSSDIEYGNNNASYSHRRIEISGWKAWLTTAAVIILIVLVLSLVFRVLIALLPFIIGTIIVISVIKLFTDR